VLSVDPFDQPNVQEAKDRTKALLTTLASGGALPKAEAVRVGDADFAAEVQRHLKGVRRNDYVAIMAYLQTTPKREKLLRDLQSVLRDKTGAATTLGYGPRFLHSTGQLHKGGANNGVFIQFVSDRKRRCRRCTCAGGGVQFRGVEERAGPGRSRGVDRTQATRAADQPRVEHRA